MRFDEGKLKDVLYAFERTKRCFSKDNLRKYLISLLPFNSCLIVLDRAFSWGVPRSFYWC